MMPAGIDVYEGDGSINWPRVSAGGTAFAYVRGAYGDRQDSLAHQNFVGAKSAGLPVGLYHFYRATRDAGAQARTMLDALDQVGFAAGDLLPALDVEDNPGYDGPWDRAKNPSYVSGLRKWVAAINDRFGCRVMIYTRASFWAEIGNPDGFSDQALWVANFGVQSPRVPHGWDRYALWQFTDAGAVDGVHGHCDQNYFNGTADKLGDITRG